MTRRIAVVGAGIAGLTAAYFLKQAGHDAVVLEASSRVGGRMTSDVIDGFTIDRGAQFLSNKYPVLSDLIARLHLTQAVFDITARKGTVRNGRLRKYRTSGAFTPVRTGLLTVPAWLRLVWGGVRLRRTIRSLPTNDLSAWSAFDDVDAQTWSDDYFGAEVTRYMIEPPVGGLYFQSLSANARAVPLLTSAFFYAGSTLTGLAGGIGALPERLATELDVRLDRPVRSLRVSDAGVELEMDSEHMVADRVILATTGSAARVLYAQANDVERRLLETAYSCSLTVAVMVKASYRMPADMSDLYGFFIPKAERGVVASVANEGCKDKARVGNGHLLVAFVAGEAAPGLIDRDDAEIAAAVLPELDVHYPGVSGAVSAVKVYRWKEAMPCSPVGRSTLVAQYRATRDELTRVFLAGDYMGMPFTEGAAETGAWAARSLVSHMRETVAAV